MKSLNQKAINFIDTREKKEILAQLVDQDEDKIIGKSKFSEKLKQQINKISTDLKPVILQGNHGTGITFIAKSIHDKSALKKESFNEFNCYSFPKNKCSSSENQCDCNQGENQTVNLNINLLTTKINSLEKGTILVNNAHLLSEFDWRILSKEIQQKQENIRLILASPEKLNNFTLEHHAIKLLSLSQRRADIPEFANYFLEKFCQEKGRNLLTFNQASLRRLISYDYPGNITELETIIKRLVLMIPESETILTEKLLWSLESTKNAFRLDLLNQFPWLRKFILSRWYPQALWLIIMVIFVPITIMGFVGPQTRSENVILNLFWAWWWPIYLLLFPILGRFWCSVCPFMITGEWLRKFSLWLFPRQQLSWTSNGLNQWGSWFVFVSFTAIYLWEKLWDLSHTPYLSASLFLIITGGAVIFSLIYENRLWCRYLCPIGGMNGMFAKLSVIELRSSEAVCGSQCTTQGCYKGGDATPVTFAEALPNEAQATEGCPFNLGPSKLTDNRNCILCMGCIKACPHRSIQLNLRFPGSDLWQNHHGFWAEIALMLLLFGGVFLHYSDTILSRFGLDKVLLDSQHLLTAIPCAILFLSVPFLLTFSIHQIAKLVHHQIMSYEKVIYAYLLMTLAVNLAYHLPFAVTEAGSVFQVIANTFGYNNFTIPSITWSLDVANFLQDSVLLTGLIGSIYFLYKITQNNFLSSAPHLLLMVGFTGFLMSL